MSSKFAAWLGRQRMLALLALLVLVAVAGAALWASKADAHADQPRAGPKIVITGDGASSDNLVDVWMDNSPGVVQDNAAISDLIAPSLSSEQVAVELDPVYYMEFGESGTSQGHVIDADTHIHTVSGDSYVGQPASVFGADVYGYEQGVDNGGSAPRAPIVDVLSLSAIHQTVDTGLHESFAIGNSDPLWGISAYLTVAVILVASFVFMIQGNGKSFARLTKFPSVRSEERGHAIHLAHPVGYLV